MRRFLVLLAGLAALGAAPAQAAAPPPSVLLARFAPVLTLAPGEPFAPIRASGFLHGAVQEQLPDGSTRLNVEPCLAAEGPAAVPCYAQVRTLPVTYARYQALGDRIFLSYWFLYEDDLLLLPVAGDALWQAHEGDWEAVAVVLDASGQPLEAAYSAHCTGHVRPWDQVPLAGGEHPQVFVALGSHANYFEPGLHPIPSSCYPPQVAAVLAQYGVAPQDVTGAGATVTPRVVRIRPHEPDWVEFPGTWGEEQYFHAPAPIGTVALGTSPQGPAFHPLFSDPLATIASWPAG